MRKKKEKTAYEIAKGLKLARNRKPSFLFGMFKEEGITVVGVPHVRDNRNKNAAARELLVQHSAPGQGRRHRRNRKLAALRGEMLKAIKDKYRPEQVCNLTKKTRRKWRGKFTNEEWPVFCWYVKSCRRGRKTEWIGRAHASGCDRALRRGRTAKQKKNAGRQAYENYINSTEWMSVKNKYYQKYGRFCAACGSVNRVHLHHMYYGNFGHEEDADLVPLCNQHHEQYHLENGTQRDMVQRTRAFIDNAKSQLIEVMPVAA